MSNIYVVQAEDSKLIFTYFLGVFTSKELADDAVKADKDALNVYSGADDIKYTISEFNLNEQL